MPLTINTNTAATLATANLASANTQLTRSLNRLSSGSKIQQPADDAGGLAVSMKLSAAARRMGAASTNIANSVSFLQTQDGALKVAGKILDRISELKTFAVDPTKNASDIANYNQEFIALQKELKAVAAETFNGKSLFSTNDIDVATTEDGATSLTMAGISLLGAGGSSISGSISASQNFTPSGPGRFTNTSTSGTIDIFSSSTMQALWLAAGESAVYDGAGTWSGGYGPTTTFAGSPSVEIAQGIGGGSEYTFVPDGASIAGDVATANSLGELKLSAITGALQEIATHRAANGGYQSRLMMASELLATNKANMEQANSRIVDVDVAEESGALARANVLVQAGTSMLSQAKDSSQMALRLIS